MTRTEREELLRRYFDGEMSLEQEHDFFIEVALDKELRHGLKAQQEIDAAMKADRSNPTPAEYASLQSGLAGVLAAMPGTQAAETTAGVSTAGTTGSGIASWGILAGIGLVGTVVAVLLVVFFSSPGPHQMPEAIPTSPSLQPAGESHDDPVQVTPPMSSDTMQAVRPVQVRDPEVATESRTIQDRHPSAVQEQATDHGSGKDQTSVVQSADPTKENPVDELTTDESITPPAASTDAQDKNDEEIDIRAKVFWQNSNDEGAEQD